MIGPSIAQVQTYDFPSLAHAARGAAERAANIRHAAEHFRFGLPPEDREVHANTYRAAGRAAAHAEAERDDFLRLAHLADLLEQHPCLVEAVEAIEAGGRVTVSRPAESRARVLTMGARPPRPDAARFAPPAIRRPGSVMELGVVPARAEGR